MYQASHVWKDSRNQPLSFLGSLRKGVWPVQLQTMVNNEGEIHLSLLVGKSRVMPKKFLSIPRLELAAVLLSAKMVCLVRKELNLGNVAEKFWTDSQVVLVYIRNTTKKSFCG